jgi:hypothetical protein
MTKVRFSGDAQELLEKYDCQQVSQIGDIYIARIPVAQLPAAVYAVQVGSQGSTLIRL